jgi:hypothetical protein
MQSATSIFVTPRASTVPDSGTARASFTLSGQSGEVFAIGSAAVATSEVSQLVVVVEGTVMRLFHDGEPQGTSPIGSLAEIDDNNNWLGRSQWSSDEEFAGSYDDFRIYNVALSAESIAALYAAGPDHQFD